MNFKEFLKTYQKDEVVEFANQVVSNPAVSVCIQAYKHGNYIGQCLDSILSQKTDFSFEILIGEDDSPDDTRAICLEYAKKYPNTIRLFLHKRANNIAISGKPTGRFNFLYNFYMANGTYIALCDGDDYWLNDTKLQEQWNFMQQRESCSFCFHDTKLFFEASNTWKDQFLDPSNQFDGIAKQTSLFKRLGGAYPTASAFFKSQIVKEIPLYFFEFLVGDSPLLLRAIEFGDIGYINGLWSVYRINSSNWTHSQKSIHNKLIHYNATYKGLDTFNRLSGNRFSNEISITQEHATYQLIYFYLSLPESFSKKLKFIKKYASRLSLGNLLKSVYWLIRFQFS